MYGLTVDCISVSSATVQSLWPMPNIRAELAEARRVKAFIAIDLCIGYREAPLHRDSQPLSAFMIPDSVVMPIRTTQGGTDSAVDLQERVADCFAELRENFEASIDDFILFAKNEEHLLQILRRFFAICRNQSAVLGFSMSEFFPAEATWCGRTIDVEGVRFIPKTLSGLRNCDILRSAGELCQYVNGVSLISSSIPRFAKRAGNLCDLLEVGYAKAGDSRKKIYIARVLLVDRGCSEKHESAFIGLPEQLQGSTRLAHRDFRRTLCLHTDPSDRHRAICVARCVVLKLCKPLKEQAHLPLPFLSGTCFELE